MRALIIGAGIGGLCAAGALSRVGVEVQVFERKAELVEVGAGLNLSANAMKVLGHLGAAGRLPDLGVATRAFDMRSVESDEVMLHIPLGEEAERRYGAPYLQLLRADLLDALVGVVPAGSLNLADECVGFVQDDTSVTARFATGETARGDVLIGADGANSVIRARLLGGEYRPSHDLVAVRALVGPGVELGVPEGHSLAWWGPGRGGLSYWVGRPRRLNVAFVLPSRLINAGRGSTLQNLAVVRSVFADCAATLRRVLDHVEDAFVTGLGDLEPLPRWSRGRVTLLGDAAHPMFPFLGQGACQAIEDALILARCVAAHPQSPAEALLAYQTCRQPRTGKVQAASRQSGQMWLSADPAVIGDRDQTLKILGEQDPHAEQMWSWVARYDATTAPLSPENPRTNSN